MFRIDLAEAKDAPVLAEIRQKSWENAYRGIYSDHLLDDYDIDAHAGRFLEQMENPTVEVYLISRDGKPVGYLTLGHSGKYRDFPACLHSLYLVPACHRTGIGRYAMDFVKQWCKNNGYNRVYNSCNLHNHSARAFYEAMGGVLGQIDDGYDDPGADQCYYEYYLE